MLRSLLKSCQVYCENILQVFCETSACWFLFLTPLLREIFALVYMLIITTAPYFFEELCWNFGSIIEGKLKMEKYYFKILWYLLKSKSVFTQIFFCLPSITCQPYIDIIHPFIYPPTLPLFLGWLQHCFNLRGSLQI